MTQASAVEHQADKKPCACGGHGGACTCKDHPPIQRLATGPATSFSPSAAAVLARPGEALGARSRATFERSFGTDLSGVRVHADPLAARAADDLHAEAWTSGHHVVIGAGRYAPGTIAGDRLLAHELTHVVQQRTARPSAVFAGDDPAAESHADAAASRVAEGGLVGRLPPAASSSGVARQPKAAGGGVHRVEINGADKQMTFDGPNAHTWKLTDCDLADGEYSATAHKTVGADGGKLVQFLIVNAPAGIRFRFTYHVEGREVDPYDSVTEGQALHIHAVASPAAPAPADGADQRRTSFQVSVIDASEFTMSTGVVASTLPEGQIVNGSRFTFGVAAAGPRPTDALSGFGLGSGSNTSGNVARGVGFGLNNLPPYVSPPVDPWAGTFSDSWANGGAAAFEAAARAKAASSGGFVPSWALDPASQAGWRTTSIVSMTKEEIALVEAVANGSPVLGRSFNVRNQGGFVLDDWLIANNLKWSQRWQDVYNRALYERTVGGSPVRGLAGGGYTAAEVEAAEAGAKAGGILNEPFWWNKTVPAGDVLGQLPKPPPATGLKARFGLSGVPTGVVVRGVLRVGGKVLLIYGVYSSVSRIADAPAGQGFTVAGEEAGAWAGGWVGAALSSALAGALVCSETGPGALVCAGAFGILGGIGGAEVGTGLGHDAANALQNAAGALRNPAALTEGALQMFGTDQQRRDYYQTRDDFNALGF